MSNPITQLGPTIIGFMHIKCAWLFELCRYSVCLVITGWVTLIIKITGALTHVSTGSQIICNKNSLCNFHHHCLPKLLVQQLYDIVNECIAILCVWRLTVVHCINYLSEPGVLMWHKLWQSNNIITCELYHPLSWELTQLLIHTHTHIATYMQHIYVHTYSLTT